MVSANQANTKDFRRFSIVLKHLVEMSFACKTLPARMTRSRTRIEAKEKRKRRFYKKQCINKPYNLSNHVNTQSVPKEQDQNGAQPAEPLQYDDQGLLICHKGDKIKSRYEVIGILGQGTFGRVFEVKDLELNRVVALKIVKNLDEYTNAAKWEIKVLEEIRAKDSGGLCALMLGWFNYHNHICIAFEKLGQSIYDILRENNFEPFPLDHVRNISHQLIESVKFLHNNKLTHTDIKPENILFVNSDYTLHKNSRGRTVRTINCLDIRLIDFGSAVYDHEDRSETVTTKRYRAPEVILKLGWAQPCDVWSVGCVMFELYRGTALFKRSTSIDHLATMERLLGPIPPQMAVQSKRKHYFKDGKLDWDEDPSPERCIIRHTELLKEHMISQSAEEVLLFDLIGKMLEYEPSRRITSSEAINESFFKSI